MNRRRLPAFSLIVALTLSLVLVSGGTVVTKAQGPQPPTCGLAEPVCAPEEIPGPWKQSPLGEWLMRSDGQTSWEVGQVTPQDAGGPDDFGYTWDDSVALDWIDASAGTDTGIDSSTDHVGPIDIGFSFKYYENTYDQVYISRFGFVAFNDEGIYNSQSRIPSPGKPDDVIAPHWAPAFVNGYVRYLQGGSAPGRWFVVEWNRLESETPDGATQEYTFEVILHENGDIVFQYGAMTVDGSYWCQASGIEDSRGLDGLGITVYCRRIAPNHAVRIYRPSPQARVTMWPLYHGRFTHAGETVAFEVHLRNPGELGADTYDLTTPSTWPVSFYAADGTTSLTDTDGDGTIDTGSVAQGGTVTVTVKVETPLGASVGDDNAAAVTVRSSLDTARSKTVTLQTAVPAPFAQVYRDDADGAMTLYLVQPGAQSLKKVTSDHYFGHDMAVAEMPDSFAYFWTTSRQEDSVYMREIEYALLDRYGQTVCGVRKLTDHTGATVYTYDYDPAVAVASDGRIGVAWYRYLYNSSDATFNYNIYYAVLGSGGNTVVPPTNLTNNALWGSSLDWPPIGVPRFTDPRIAATGENHFVLAWERTFYTDDGSLDDIYYAIRDTTGGEVKPVAPFTSDTPGMDESYYFPTLTRLSGNRVLVAWSRGSNGDVYYAVLDSTGNTVKAATALSTGTGGWSPDAAQLSDGNIVIGWGGWVAAWQARTRFAVLDGAYNRIAGPTTLDNPAAATGDYYVSVAADGAGRAILTWMDYDHSARRNLYYALVDGAGNVLTDPMIFRTSQAANPYIETSDEGYGNTSYSWTAPSDVDGVAAFGNALFGGPPGGTAQVAVQYANHGTTIATDVVLTATLDSSLTYMSDTSGTAGTPSGNDVVWHLPDLAFLDAQSFTLYLGVPSVDYGVRYPVTLTLSSAGPEANASDNIAPAEVMVARQAFLPLVLKDW